MASSEGISLSHHLRTRSFLLKEIFRILGDVKRPVFHCPTLFAELGGLRKLIVKKNNDMSIVELVSVAEGQDSGVDAEGMDED